MEKAVDVLQDFVTDVQKKNHAQIGFTWRNVDDQQNYRVALVAHEEAVLNAALAAPSASAEREELIKQYRLLRDYRIASNRPAPINPVATEYVRENVTPLVNEEHKGTWERILTATAEIRNKFVKQL